MSEDSLRAIRSDSDYNQRFILPLVAVAEGCVVTLVTALYPAFLEVWGGSSEATYDVLTTDRSKLQITNS